MSMESRPLSWTPPATPPNGLETPRLQIRAYAPSDAEALFDAIDVSRASLRPWLPWVEHYRSVRDAVESIERFRLSSLDVLKPEHNTALGYVYGVFEKASGRLVGGTGFNRISPEWHNAETGYWVRADRRREGIASEMLARVLSAGLVPQAEGGFGFRRVHLFASAANTASCGVPEKLGLHRAMHARQDRWIDGLGWTDSLGWDVLSTQWDTDAHRLLTRPTAQS